MKLSELKQIIHLLPDDTEVTIGEAQTSHLVKETWGNHDGRYNMRCTVCGWTSNDISARDNPPTVCPRCGK